MKNTTPKTPSYLTNKPNEMSPVLEWVGWFLLFAMINRILSVSTLEAHPNISILVLPIAAILTLGIRYFYKKKFTKAKF